MWCLRDPLKIVELVSLKDNFTPTHSQPNTIPHRQAEGIFAAKLAGKSFGRPRINLPLNFSEIITDWQNGKIAAVEAMRKVGMKKTTFYKAIKGLG
jgi:DNA invertase Pin-like site-specific DNA recombinase